MEGNSVVISKLAESALRQLRCTIGLHAHLQCMNSHIDTITIVTVLLKTSNEIRRVHVVVTNSNTVVTEVIHKEVDANKCMDQGCAGEIRCTINMNKLARRSHSMCLCVNMRVVVEVDVVEVASSGRFIRSRRVAKASSVRDSFRIHYYERDWKSYD